MSEVDCPAPEELVEREIGRTPTQYRESPRLLGLIRAYLRQVEAAARVVCDLPNHFDLDTAVGHQLTLIGKRMGFPRTHCVCDISPVFGLTAPAATNLMRFSTASDFGAGTVGAGATIPGHWGLAAFSGSPSNVPPDGITVELLGRTIELVEGVATPLITIRVHGTPTADTHWRLRGDTNGGANGGPAVSPGQQIGIGYDIGLVSGMIPDATTYFTEFDAAGANLLNAPNETYAVPSVVTRKKYMRVTSSWSNVAIANVVIDVPLSAGVAYDFTVKVGGWQIEAGKPTAFIVTDGAPATRDDECSAEQPFPLVGFCEDGVWLDCGAAGRGEITITDDETYRAILKARRFQMLGLYDIQSLYAALRMVWGPAAHVPATAVGHFVIAPGRARSPMEQRLVPVVVRALPVAPGIRVQIHYGAETIFGFGEGWGGLCEGTLNQFLISNGDLTTPGGIALGPADGAGSTPALATEVTGTAASWLCPESPYAYDCAA